MTVAFRLAEFLVGQRTTNLPQQALEHAAMLIASTIASAACGKNLESSRIMRELAEERGGRADAAVWFTGPKLPIADAAQVNAVEQHRRSVRAAPVSDVAGQGRGGAQKRHQGRPPRQIGPDQGAAPVTEAPMLRGSRGIGYRGFGVWTHTPDPRLFAQVQRSSSAAGGEAALAQSLHGNVESDLRAASKQFDDGSCRFGDGNSTLDPMPHNALGERRLAEVVTKRIWDSRSWFSRRHGRWPSTRQRASVV